MKSILDEFGASLTTIWRNFEGFKWRNGCRNWNIILQPKFYVKTFFDELGTSKTTVFTKFWRLRWHHLAIVQILPPILRETVFNELGTSKTAIWRNLEGYVPNTKCGKWSNLLTSKFYVKLFLTNCENNHLTKLGKMRRMFTVWKLINFAITQILREIVFEELGTSKTTFFDQILKAKSQCGNWAIFLPLKFYVKWILDESGTSKTTVAAK